VGMARWNYTQTYISTCSVHTNPGASLPGLKHKRNHCMLYLTKHIMHKEDGGGQDTEFLKVRECLGSSLRGHYHYFPCGVKENSKNIKQKTAPKAVIPFKAITHTPLHRQALWKTRQGENSFSNK
jgi:hypothetical protein